MKDTIMGLIQQLKDMLANLGGDGSFLTKIIDVIKGLFATK